MNILFYLEPSLEMPLNPLFRYPTLRNNILPQMKSLKEFGFNVHLLLSDTIAEIALKENYLNKNISFSTVDMFEWTKLKEIHSSNIKEFCPFVPDLIMVWESKCDFFNVVFPNTPILYEMPGFFSRVPYPEYISFDFGLLNKATQHLNTQEITKEEIFTIDTYRNKMDNFFNLVTPIKNNINKLKNQFKTIILFPLQIDGYFMVDDSIKKNQFHTLIDLLEKTPKDVGFLVTNYKSKDTQTIVFSDSNIAYLQKKYSNFIYDNFYDNVPYVSQFLVPHVQGVFTISSSVGYQAAFFEKQVFTPSINHISLFNTASSYEEFIKNCLDNQKVNQDDKIALLLKNKHLTQQSIKNSDFFGNFIKNIIENKEFLSTNIDIEKELTKLTRKSNLISELHHKSLNIFSNIGDACEELHYQIKKHDVISFDIFDTLLVRAVKHPQDIFELMNEKVNEIIGYEIDFKLERKEAEKLAFHDSISKGEGETTFNLIYEYLSKKLKLNENQTQSIKQLELNMETEFLYKRNSGYLAYEYARALNKKIIIVSDMYLEEEFLKMILEKNGYKNYEKIYVSSVYKEKKHSGKLFDFVLKDYEKYSGRILHVGDNLIADVQKAKEKGLKPFHLVKSVEKFETTPLFNNFWKKDKERRTLTFRTLGSLIIEKMFSNSYSKDFDRSYFGGKAHIFGYGAFGLLLFGYVKWLIENSIKDGKEELYFLARDGKIMKEAYDIIAPLYENAPKSHYLLCSRRSVNVAKLKTFSDIKSLMKVDFAKNSFKHLLENRFGISPNNLNDEELEKNGINLNTIVTMNDSFLVESYLHYLQDVILENAKEERENYLDYLNEIGYLNDSKKAIVDIGYAGTMQESLFQLTNIKVDGYYLITFRQALNRVIKNGMKCEGYLANFIDRHDTYHPFCKHVPLYETLFSGIDTSFVKMEKLNDTLIPCYMNKYTQEKKREHVVEQIQNGALDFIKDTKKLKSIFSQLDVEPNQSMRNLIRFFDEPSPKDVLIFEGVVFEDAYGGAGLKTILPTLKNMEKENCVWIKGKETFINSIKNEQQKVETKKVEIKEEIKLNTSNEFNIKITNESEMKYKVAKLILSPKKYHKLIYNPTQFFNDVKSKFSPLLKKIYIKEN